MEKKQVSNENRRALVLESYNLKNINKDPDYDELINLAATICDVPVAFLSIIEPLKISFKSKMGIDLTEIERDISFTQAILDSGKEFISINYQEDPKIFDNSSNLYNNNFQFFAGFLLKDPSGYPLGALIVLDHKERTLEENQVRALKVLANQSMKLIEFSKQKHQFQLVQHKLKQKYEELEKFASLVSHDIKSPLANIISLTELLKEENIGKFDEETTQYLNYLVESSYALRNYVDGILTFYRSEHILEKDYENVDLHQLLQGIAKLYEVSENIIIQYPSDAVLKNVNKAALTQVFLNLISNGLKYNQKPVRKIEIKFKEESEYYVFDVIDNGEGFPEENADKIFQLFTTLDTVDRDGNPGSGIGLATVHKLVNSMGGKITFKSTPGEGSCFTFTIQRH